eukprot:GHVH01007718.1.p1 GENE.GHVH01007718.1~~GHVH01007718.1.p1  ORF type:complete len:132 (+),score=18.02 GHVH01007718.1:149-544(+)
MDIVLRKGFLEDDNIPQVDSDSHDANGRSLFHEKAVEQGYSLCRHLAIEAANLHPKMTTTKSEAALTVTMIAISTGMAIEVHFASCLQVKTSKDCQVFTNASQKVTLPFVSVKMRVLAAIQTSANLSALIN